MNSQSRTFVKQVQQDLLALSDTDLYHIVRQWVDGEDTSGYYPDVAEDTLRALGYTYLAVETPLSVDGSETVKEMPVTWQSPSPTDLRNLLTDMDANLFAQHVIVLAYRSLHSVYPEWFDGLTFNAHLANYLRQMRTHWPTRPVDIVTTRNPRQTS